MGNNQQKALAENFAAQLKFAQKNRKSDGRKGKDLALTPQDILDVWQQIAFEYPFMETVSDSAIMTSHSLPDEPIVFCNDDFTALTGYPKEEILGRNCRFLQGKYTDPKAVQRIRDAIKNGTKVELELLNYRKDGTPFLNGFCMLPVHEKGKKDGKVAYFLAIQKNVTVIVNPWRAPIKNWSVPEVCMWLDKNGAGSYCKGFLAKDISGSLLENLTVQGMIDCGVVLASEQTRLTRLIQNEKALRLARGENFATERYDQTNDKTDLSVDDSTSVAKSQQSVSSVAGGSSRQLNNNNNNNNSVEQRSAIDVNNEEEDESLSEANAFKNSTRTPNPSDEPAEREKKSSRNAGISLSGNTSRKTAISASFVHDLRPPVSLIVSSASTSLLELRRVLRKKTGRKYDCHELKTATGLASGLTLQLEPSMEGLDLVCFSVLDGILLPVVVTDNLGLIVFANDCAWQRLGVTDDPVDMWIAKLVKLPFAKLDFVNELRSNRFQCTLEDKSTINVVVSPATLGKCKLHVWLFSE